MLFSKMNFRQLFVSRPGRRRGAYSVAAEVQTLQSKVLPSAVPIEVEEAAVESPDDYMSESSYESPDDYMSESSYESTDDYMYESSYESTDDYTYESSYESTDDYTYESSDESTDYMSESSDDYTSESSDEYMYESTDDESSTEAMYDSSVSGGSGDNGEGESPDAWINEVQTSNSGGAITVSGNVSSLSGDFSNLTLSFEGAFAGTTATIASDGSFSASVPSGTTGNVGFVNLLQTENGVTTQIGQHSMYV
jgi:hypothetical protein